MPTYIKGKIPWLKIIVVLMLIAFAIVIVGFVVPGAGTAMVNGIAGLGVGIYEFFFVYPSWISVITAVAITAGLFLLVTQRKYIFKQKISNSTVTTTAPAYQSGLINNQPLQAAPIPQQIIAQPIVNDGKTEVTTA